MATFLKTITNLVNKSKINYVPTRGIFQANNLMLTSPIIHQTSSWNMVTSRHMNRNARVPKKANHGKRPVSHARRWARRTLFKSRNFRTKIFGYF